MIPNLDPHCPASRRAGCAGPFHKYYLGEGGNKDPVIIDMPRGAYVPECFLPLSVSGGRGRCQVRLLFSGRPAPCRSPAGPSVAVMPLLNLTGDPNRIILQKAWRKN